MVYVIRKEHFNAAHRLFNPNWTEEKNLEVFGPCANNNWHGHNFELFVTVKGKPDASTGFVTNLKNLIMRLLMIFLHCLNTIIQTHEERVTYEKIYYLYFIDFIYKNLFCYQKSLSTNRFY